MFIVAVCACAVVSTYLNTGYREDPISSRIYKQLIREIFMRDVRTATDLVLYSLLKNYSDTSAYIDVIGYSHSLTQEYSLTSQPLGAVEAAMKMKSCNNACQKRQDTMNPKEMVAKSLDCHGICSRHVSSMHSSPVLPYRLLLYWSDKRMIRMREWIINFAIKETGSSSIFVEEDKKEEIVTERSVNVIGDYASRDSREGNGHNKGEL